MSGSIFKRMGNMLFQYWPLIFISVVSAFVFVVLNSASIWLTATLINNILTDFDEIIKNQAELAGKSILTANEQLKYWTNKL